MSPRRARRQAGVDILDSDASGSNPSHSDTSHLGIRRPRIVASPQQPPLYTIDLSLPPGERYTHICNDYQHELAELIGIYEDLLLLTGFPRFFSWFAKLLLNKVYSREETKEIRGISKATKIPLHLVVAYNTFLDLFSGCMSGGAQVKVPQAKGTRMMHFRNLDWDMEHLRDMIIRVEYVRGGIVVARSVYPYRPTTNLQTHHTSRGVTYAGYVGVLTGVR